MPRTKRISPRQAAAQLLLDLMIGTVAWGIVDPRSAIHHSIGDEDAILEALEQKTAGDKRLDAVRGEMGSLLKEFIEKLSAAADNPDWYSDELEELLELHGKMIKPKKVSA